MKSLTYSFLGALLLLLASCGKEKSFEVGQLSQGSLQSDLTGECLPKVVNGTYKEGAALGDTNTIRIQVSVLQTGPYTITTDTINGYSFKASGTFSATGSNDVTLKGSGTPVVAGTNTFTVIYDSTTCSVPVTVISTGGGGGGGGNTAVYTLVGAGANCGFTVNGTYTQGSALTAANTVSLQLNVTTPGTYSISTNTVNGITFTGSGTLSGTGPQTVTLVGSGTPTPAGTPTFLVTAGSGTCNFSLTVNPGSQPSGNNHFPMTLNTWWSYEDPYTSQTGDTLKTVVTGTFNYNNQTYTVFETTDQVGDGYEQLFRKSGNDVYEYTAADAYSFMSFDADVEGELLVLKEGAVAGTTWTSPEFSGLVSTVPTKLKYEFTLTENNATVTVGGKSFTNVYKIRFKARISTNNGTSWTDEMIWDAWYANNIGLIYLKGTLGTQGSFEMPVRYWNVK